MKPLETSFSYGGFQFRQVDRDGKVALFAKQKPGHSRESFEVVIVWVYPACLRFGVEYPERELMPPSESWGKSGWTFQTLESARKRFNELT